MFCQIKAIGEGSQKPGDYYRFVEHWNVQHEHGDGLRSAGSMYRHRCVSSKPKPASDGARFVAEDPSSSLKDGNGVPISMMTFLFKENRD